MYRSFLITGSDVAHRRTFFLSLLDPGIHEYRAARAEVHRTACLQGFLDEHRQRHAQGFGKGFHKRTASGRAGFVELDAVHHAVFDVQAFDVLAADVQHERNVGQEKLSRLAVGQGFHLVDVGPQSGPDEAAAVARHSRGGDADVGGHAIVNFAQDVHGRAERFSLAGSVGGVENAAALVDQRGLDGGGAAVDAQVYGGGLVGRAFQIL